MIPNKIDFFEHTRLSQNVIEEAEETTRVTVTKCVEWSERIEMKISR